MTKANDNSKEIGGLTTSVAVILNKVGYIETEVKEIKYRMEKEYVTQEAFEPIKKIVYGMVGLILVAVAGGLLSVILK